MKRGRRQKRKVVNGGNDTQKQQKWYDRQDLNRRRRQNKWEENGGNSKQKQKRDLKRRKRQ